jgi:hydroxysqualene synthase
MVTDLSEAYATCARFARDHYENFPVASWLLPRPMRRHVAAVYAFARVADDFADEGDRPQGERLALLDAWRDRLHACAQADAAGRQDTAARALPPDASHIFAALGATIRSCRLPVSLFDDLLSAFRQSRSRSCQKFVSWSAVHTASDRRSSASSR